MTIFSEHLSYEQKRDTISNEFRISMTDDEESEVRSMCNYSEGVERRATARGLAKGMEQGEALLSSLINNLIEDGKTDDIKRVTTDSEFRHEMYKYYGLE